MRTASTPAHVGVFDSGVGGLTVLRALVRALPGADFTYVADAGHAPYGERDDAHVRERSRRIAAHLRSAGCDALVVACNTATAAAIDELRDAHADWTIVGVEPGLKPAVALSRKRRVGVMATQATLRSARFRRLLNEHAADAAVTLQACDGLASAIEDGDPHSHELRAAVERHAAPLRDADCDVVVLGCTHYPFAADLIAPALGPQVTLVDTADPVARHTAARVGGGMPFVARAVRPVLLTTGDPQRLAAFANAWLEFGCDVCRIEI